MRLLHDPDLLSTTIGQVYDCVLDPTRWPTVMAELAAVLGASRAFLGVGTPAGDVPTIVAAPGYVPEDFTTPALALNPITVLGLTYPPDTAFVASRDYGLEQLQRTRFHREYLAPRGIFDAIAYLVTREGNTVGHWFIATPPARGPITAEEAAGLTLVAPHIRRAVEISRVLGAQRLEAETYRAALGQLDAAVLVLDGEGRVAYANARAEAELARGTVLRVRGNRVMGATQAADAALRRITAGSLAGGAGGFEASLTGTDGQERLLFAAGLDTRVEGLFGQPARAAMLVLRSPREDTRNPVAVAARMFDLTPAQVQVLAFLAQGHAPDTIADILGISITTVRSHLAELFRRTGTSRQPELVARTLALASPVRAGPDGLG